MTGIAPTSRRVRYAPVLLTALVAFALLRAAGLWVSFSSAGAEEAGEASAQTPAAVVKPSVTSERLIEQLAARKIELDARESELDTREAVLKAAELRLDASIKAYRKERDEAMLAANNRAAAAQGDIGRLSDAYARMKPRDAARVFEVLDEEILVPVAAGMRTQSLAPVLAEMSSEKAKALTILLANRAAVIAAPEEKIQ
jgi:flagellar motility protein MotE (MotC chaperone)